MLVTMALAAVYEIRDSVCRLVEWAEMFTMRPQPAARSSGSAARTRGQVQATLAKT
jgi:hypothetical protein